MSEIKSKMEGQDKAASRKVLSGDGKEKWSKIYNSEDIFSLPLLGFRGLHLLGHMRSTMIRPAAHDLPAAGLHPDGCAPGWRRADAREA